jgi:hypothetical protein
VSEADFLKRIKNFRMPKFWAKGIVDGVAYDGVVSMFYRDNSNSHYGQRGEFLEVQPKNYAFRLDIRDFKSSTQISGGTAARLLPLPNSTCKSYDLEFFKILGK